MLALERDIVVELVSPSGGPVMFWGGKLVDVAPLTVVGATVVPLLGPLVGTWVVSFRPETGVVLLSGRFVGPCEVPVSSSTVFSSAAASVVVSPTEESGLVRSWPTSKGNKKICSSCVHSRSEV